MKLIKIRISLFFFYINIIYGGAYPSQSFNYERMQMLGSGRRVIPPFTDILSKRDAFPEPLPPKPKSKTLPPASPYHSLYQGARKSEDKRVFRERFQLTAQAIGQQVSYDGLFDCPISFLSVETASNIPIILRGGVGYNYFNIVVKSRPHDELSGQIRAYCVKTELDYYKERQTENLVKLYVFPMTTSSYQDK